MSERLSSGNEYQAVVGAFEYNIAIPAEKSRIPYLVDSFGTSSTRRDNTFYMLPGVEDICDCVLDIIRKYRWNKIAIFYEEIIGTKFYPFLLFSLSFIQFVCVYLIVIFSFAFDLLDVFLIFDNILVMQYFDKGVYISWRGALLYFNLYAIFILLRLI